MSNTEMKSPESTEKKVSTHPKVSVMVDAAIKNLADRKGSSLHAIKNYISTNYLIDVERVSIFIKKYLKASVANGDLVQTAGKGATGSFKFNKQKTEAKPKAPKVKSPKVPKVKSVKQLKMQTSTPNKAPRQKKDATKSPDKSPVKKVKLANLEAVPADATFSNPKPKAKKPKVSLPTKPRKSATSLPKKVKPKKLLEKKAEAGILTSPGVKPKTTSPKLVKTKRQEKKATKIKKSLTPKKPGSVLKKAASKKAPARGGQK